MEIAPPHVFTPHLKKVLKSYQTAAMNSLSGPSRYMESEHTKLMKHQEPGVDINYQHRGLSKKGSDDQEVPYGDRRKRRDVQYNGGTPHFPLLVLFRIKNGKKSSS